MNMGEKLLVCYKDLSRRLVCYLDPETHHPKSFTDRDLAEKFASSLGQDNSKKWQVYEMSSEEIEEKMIEIR